MIRPLRDVVPRPLRHFRRPVFVLGTGRSGTHWVGRILGSHPDFRVTVEEAPMFDWSTRMATRPGTRDRLLPRLVWRYRYERVVSLPRRYADKSHPNLWIADELARAMPGARFLAVERNPYAVVASMLEHEGVLDWIRNWRDLPQPNRFLGVDPEIVEHYEEMSLAARCALRWRSHHGRVEELRPRLGDRMRVLSYERLVRDTKAELRGLERFLELRSSFPTPFVKRESLDRWTDVLTAEQCGEIASVVGFGPEQSEARA